LQNATLHGVVRLEPAQGRQRAKLFDLGAVIKESVSDDGGWILEIRMPERDLKRFLKRERLPADALEPPPAEEKAVVGNFN